MMIVMKETATEDEIEAVVAQDRASGRAAPIAARGARVTVIGAIGDVEQDANVASLGSRASRASTGWSRSSSPTSSPRRRSRHGERTVLDIEGRKIGGEHFALIAGPCTVESREQMLATARAVVRDAGATLLRGGAYKPRTSPYAFQGLGQEGLRLLAEAKAETGLPIVTELMDIRDLDAGARGRRRHADRRAQHAELPAARGDRPLPGGRRCSSAACPRRSTSC